jgi:putative membrane protein
VVVTQGPDGERAGLGEPDERHPHALYAHGAEPDPRFSMANERTALAWMRTAVALVAAGVGLTSLVRLADLPGVVEVAAVFLCAGGGAVALLAARGWRRREQAMRTGQPLPAPTVLFWLAGGLVLLGGFLTLVIVVGLS